MAEERESRNKLTSCTSEMLAAAPVSAEYERGMVTARLRFLEEENMRLLERVFALEERDKRASFRPPEFEVRAKGIQIRGKQMVGVAMILASASVAIVYFILRK
jgi:hypothetical protein